MERLIEKLLDTLNFISVITIIFMVLSISFEIVTRYLLGNPTSWVTDVTEYSLITVLFLSVGWTLSKGGHVEITILTDRISGRSKKVQKTLSTLIGLSVSILLLWQSAFLTLSSYKAGDVFFKSLVVPKWIIYIIVTFGLLFLVFEYIRQLFFCFKGRSS